MGNILDNRGNIIGQTPDTPTTQIMPYLFSGSEGMQRSIANVSPEYRNQQSAHGLLETAPAPLAFNFGDTGTENSDAGDFTKTTVDDYYTNLLKGILDQPGTDFSQVNQPMAEYQKFAQGLSPNAIPQAYTDLVKGVGAKSEQQFGDYLKMLQTPSSAEEAIRQTEGGILEQTLKEIDREIARSVADIKLTGEEYGISGAGRVSEPITSAMAQAQGRGLEAKAGARGNLALAQLQRQAEKDKEVRQAYKERYEKGPVEELMLAQAYPQFAQLQQGEKELMYKMASAEADRRLQGLQLSSQEKQNLVDNLFKTMLTGLEIGSKENIAGAEFDLKKFLQQQQISWEKQKTEAELDWKREEHRDKLAYSKSQEKEEPGFWDSLGQNVLSSVVGGFAGGAGTGLAKKVFE